MIRVNIQDAKTHLSRYIERVEQGEIVILCRHNQPVAELRSVEPPLVQPARVAGLLKGRVQWESDAFDAMTGDELREFGDSMVFPPAGPA